MIIAIITIILFPIFAILIDERTRNTKRYRKRYTFIYPKRRRKKY